MKSAAIIAADHAQNVAKQAANTTTQQPIGSQLKNLPSVNAPTTQAPVHALARFVQGDIKGGAHAHAFRVDTIAIAIEQAYKGNADAMTEASALADGKAKKARAYHAGFAAVQSELIDGAINPAYCMKRVAYAGKLTAPENKQARELIAQGTSRSVAAFFAAFDAVMAVKPVKKAAAPAPEPVATVEPVSNDAEADDSATVQAIMALEQERIEMVAKVVAMVRNGVLSADELEALDSALAESAVPDGVPADVADTAQAAAEWANASDEEKAAWQAECGAALAQSEAARQQHYATH